jgi:hypothetical protein
MALHGARGPPELGNPVIVSREGKPADRKRISQRSREPSGAWRPGGKRSVRMEFSEAAGIVPGGAKAGKGVKLRCKRSLWATVVLIKK